MKTCGCPDDVICAADPRWQDRIALARIVDNMRERIRNTAAPVDARLRHIVTTDGVHGGDTVPRSGRGGR